MPEWLFSGLVTIAGAVLVASGVWIGAILSRRSARETAAAQATALKQSGENTLIDQLQEELTTYRTDAGRRATAQDERLNRLELNNDGYRAHIHELRSHIWDRKAPPPPEWPENLPR